MKKNWIKQWLWLLLPFFIVSCSNPQASESIPVSKPDSSVVKSVKAPVDSIVQHICEHKDLSYQYDYQVVLTRILQKSKYLDSCILQVKVIEKRTQNVIDSMKFDSISLFSSFFQDCDHTRSYVTGKNRHEQAGDNDYGDFVVADLNFDKKEDFAIVTNCYSNAGVFYTYFIQKRNHQFQVDRFLTDSMVFFPKEILKKSETLVIHERAWASAYRIRKFRLNKKTNTWKEFSNRLIE